MRDFTFGACESLILLFSSGSDLAYFESIACGPLLAVWSFHSQILKFLLGQQVCFIWEGLKSDDGVTEVYFRGGLGVTST